MPSSPTGRRDVLRAAGAVCAGAGLTVGCAPWADAPSIRAPVPPASLPGFDADPMDGVAIAWARHCRARSLPAGLGGLCTAPTPAADDAPGWRRWLARAFDAVPMVAASADGTTRDTGLVTGYHEPLLSGSLVRDRPGQVPLLGVPPGLQAGDPAYARAALETAVREALAAGAPPPAPVLGWLDDAVDAFFLQVQGSGRVVWRDGPGERLGFAAHNGHPYRAIGRVLVDEGALAPAEVTAPSIRAWLRRHPDAADRVMRTNPRFVFFRRLPLGDPDAGPVGALGVPLTAGRSVATDPAFVPPGALAWVDSRDPLDGRPWQRLVFGQDVGGAITGAVRIDVFWGSDATAAERAGLAREPGRVWWLRPRATG